MFPALTELNLDNNNISEVSVSSRSERRVTRLWISSTHLRCDPKDLCLSVSVSGVW